MNPRRSLLFAVLFAVVFSIQTARADESGAEPTEPAAQPAAEKPAADEPAAEPPAAADADDDSPEAPPSAEVTKEFDTAFQGVPHEVGDGAGPELTAEQLRAAIHAARDKVLPHLEHKMETKSKAQMAKISKLIFGFSLLGLLLLFMPFALQKRHPNRLGTLFKYSALAALTFFVTVNLFGGIALGFRSAQAALARQTNPQLKITEAFFDGLADNIEELKPLGGQLIGPTLYQLQSDDNEQPVVLLIENGQKLVKDAQVFVTVGKLFKKVDFIFAVLPIVLLLVTLVLFIVSIKPTLLEIIRLPATVASGGSGGDVIRKAMTRVGGEIVVALCTVGVLFVLTLVSGAILGFVVKPALYSIIEFFGTAIVYLQIVQGASSGLIFASLFGVILFLILNLATIILAMSFFLGKSQKIFQRRFHDQLPLRAHARFWKWGTASVLVAQLVPLVFMVFAAWALEKIETKLIGDGSSIPWAAVMLVGPLFLVLGLALFMWGFRAIKGIGFLARYKVPPVPPATL